MGNTNLNIDEELKERAKKKGVNMSSAAEEGIRNRIGYEQVDIQNPTRCEFCARPGERETRDNLGKGLVWLWPDNKWLCNKCLRHEALSRAKISQ
jgi:hypothetical protein